MEVVDTDTLWTEIELGFGVVTLQKLRLRGIDAPEVTIAAGRRARRFVEKLLKPCPFIIVKTYKDKTDKYDRWLADVYFKQGGLEGDTPLFFGEKGMFLEWDEKYSVGVKRLDDQHKILFSIINDMSEAIDRGDGNLSLGDVLDSMVSYTKVHFLAEEKFMQDYGYPDFDEHRKEHQYFAGRVESFKKELEGGPLELAEDVLEFLRKWLTAHISMKDMKYRVFFNEKGLI